MGLFDRPSEPMTNTGSRQPSFWGDDLPNRQIGLLGGGQGVVDDKVCNLYPIFPQSAVGKERRVGAEFPPPFASCDLLLSRFWGGVLPLGRALPFG